MARDRQTVVFNLSLSGLTSIRDRMERRLAERTTRKSVLAEQHASTMAMLSEMKLSAET